jgi:dTDP-4-amino-4,6-dideoxygalactose transaminase
MPSVKVPLADVVVPEEDIQVVADVYRSGWLSLGPQTRAFEDALAEYVRAGHAIAVANGTAALHLICLAAGIGPGDEVIVPSITFVATANAVSYTGARPVFADIASPTEPWLSAATVEASITARTKAVMTMSYGGHAGDLEGVVALCGNRGLLLLEDAAHGLGSRLHGRHVGTFGVAGAYSFFSNKNLAIGEGGAIVTDDAQLAERLRVLRSHGMTSLSWDRHEGRATNYDVIDLGFNYRIDEPRAALAAARLARLDRENDLRRALDERYRKRLGAFGITCPLQPIPGLRSAHHLFTMLLPDGANREDFRARLAEDGVQTSVHYEPVHHFSIYAEGAPSLPIADDYGRRSVTLPMFAHMTDAQQDLVVEAVAAALG